MGCECSKFSDCFGSEETKPVARVPDNGNKFVFVVASWVF